MNSKWKNLLHSYFLAFGVVSFLLMILRNVKPHVMEPDFMYAMAVTLFVNLAMFQLIYRQNVSLVNFWIRRILHIGQISITTPIIFILFGCVKPERYLVYFISSVVLIELLTFVGLLLADRHTTRMTIDKINETLKKNREE